ncbi:hypothetical protein LEP1GSC092_0485, partial [Leptospira interrogans serovar Pyrogenes str. R168]
RNPFILDQFFRKKIDVGTLTNHGFTQLNFENCRKYKKNSSPNQISAQNRCFVTMIKI